MPISTSTIPTTITMGRVGKAAIRTKPVTKVPNSAPAVPTAE
jgi:hypothetical protein